MAAAQTSNTSDVLASVTTQGAAETQLNVSSHAEGLDDVIDLRTYKTIVAVCDYGIYPVLFAIGTPTNVANALVFWRQGLRERMNLCLFVLALSDLGYILVVSALDALSVFTLFDPDRGSEYYTKCLAVLIGPMYALKTTTGCVTMVIAVERCVCVVFPLKASSVMSTRAMAVLLMSIVSSSFLLHVAVNLKYTASGVYSNESGRTQWRLVPSQSFLLNKAVFEAVHDILLSLVVPVATFVVVSLSTARTVAQLKFSLSWRKASTNLSAGRDASVQQLALTRMFVLISGVYIVCSTPIIAVSLARSLVPDFTSGGRYYNLFLAVHVYSVAITVVNSSVGFFVYFWRSSRYRNTLGTICRRTRLPLRK